MPPGVGGVTGVRPITVAGDDFVALDHRSALTRHCVPISAFSDLGALSSHFLFFQAGRNYRTDHPIRRKSHIGRTTQLLGGTANHLWNEEGKYRDQDNENIDGIPGRIRRSSAGAPHGP